MRERSLFKLEDLGDYFFVLKISADAVDGFGWKNNDAAGFKDFDG